LAVSNARSTRVFSPAPALRFLVSAFGNHVGYQAPVALEIFAGDYNAFTH